MRRSLGCLCSMFFHLAVCWGQRSNTDDGRDSCTRCDLQLHCNCSCRGFTQVPRVTDEALVLDLSFNNISEVTDDDLRGHAFLRVLDLHGNSLASIHPSAFGSLWSLEELDLSDNQLTVLNHRWFSELGALQQLNLLNNPYRHLGSSLFYGLVRLRVLEFGGPVLEELSRGDLRGVTQLDRLTLRANNLIRYESGTLAGIWPLGRLTLNLQRPLLTDSSLVSAVLNDVLSPETHLTLEDIYMTSKTPIQILRDTNINRTRHLSLRNCTVSDEAVVGFLMAINGSPLTSLSIDGLTVTGEGRWAGANWTDLRSMDEFLVRNLVLQDVFTFFLIGNLYFLVQNQRKISLINAKLFLLSCYSTRLMKDVQYLDMSDNLLTDLTLGYMLCNGDDTLTDLRVLNISGNNLKSLSTISRLAARLTKLTHLDISRGGYCSMPPRCSWPAPLRYLNISSAKLTTATPCLSTTLEVLDLSNNDLKSFTVSLPLLRELHLSGNKFLSFPDGRLFPNLQTLTMRVRNKSVLTLECVLNASSDSFFQSNTLNLFGGSDLQSYRRLENLQAGQNKFVCSCDFVGFLQLLLKGGGDVVLTDKEDSYHCDSPLYLQGESVSRVHLSIIVCHQVLFVSVSCGVALLLASLVCVLLWRLHAFWYLKMIWAWLKAKRSSQQRQRRRNDEGSEALISFDAFVSYSEQDASWVENFLVPELEDPSDPLQPLTLCLHKRDFLPGQWIVDNILSAIERSRRTVFVLSKNFVRSSWCRYELDFSHFRFFDAGGDEAILILLEPMTKDDVPKRFCKLRKLMSSTTYLEWPQEEERREEFWRSLRNALRGE
ncbi:toll-like receptor 2 isoform X1 [Oryzias melastigma]|uniref:toll-like receptor 2 isoform X1 n=1 Tax=Oryzias melastigma TaxID=30732 RepID=UPI00168CC903|nr:toll-like receptor 2 isoform X1 [Oryzias melastigma]